MMVRGDRTEVRNMECVLPLHKNEKLTRIHLLDLYTSCYMLSRDHIVMLEVLDSIVKLGCVVALRLLFYMQHGL
jgi:hypothetical protein